MTSDFLHSFHNPKIYVVVLEVILIQKGEANAMRFSASEIRLKTYPKTKNPEESPNGVPCCLYSNEGITPHVFSEEVLETKITKQSVQFLT
jgi:hypothetical protein